MLIHPETTSPMVVAPTAPPSPKTPAAVGTACLPSAPDPMENGADILPKQSDSVATGPQMQSRLITLGIPVNFVTRRRTGEHAGCYVAEFLRFAWANGPDSPPIRQEVAPPLTYAGQIRDQLGAKIIDAWESVTDWRKNPADHIRTSAGVIFALNGTDPSAIPAIGAHRVAPSTDHHTEPDGSSPYMVENIYAVPPGCDWLDYAYPPSPDNVAVGAQRAVPNDAPNHLIDLSPVSRSIARQVLIRALPKPPQPVALLPATVPVGARPAVSESGDPAFYPGQVLHLPNTSLRLPVQRVVRVQNTYYEFGSGATFSSGVPVIYRHSEQALLAVNSGAATPQ
jgi:hypothetical protein